MQESGSLSDVDLEIYTKHLDKLKEDFKRLFEDLEKMHVPDWILRPFDMEMQNADVYLQLQEDLFNMTMDLAAKHCSEVRA